MIKYGVFDQGIANVYDQVHLSKVKEIFNQFPRIEAAIISSVKALENKEYEILTLFCPVHVLSTTSKIPFKQRYASPQTLGMDRIALATAAYYRNPKGNTLVIDMGTCITYEFVTDHGEYLGGAISPGLQMRYQAMHDQTAKLPLLAPEFPLEFIGNTTATSMHNGVMQGILHELEGTIAQYKNRYPHLTVILTGGDSHFFAERLKNSIFAHSKFLLEGLNYLLEYNKR